MKQYGKPLRTVTIEFVHDRDNYLSACRKYFIKNKAEFGYSGLALCISVALVPVIMLVLTGLSVGTFSSVPLFIFGVFTLFIFLYLRPLDYYNRQITSEKFIITANKNGLSFHCKSYKDVIAWHNFKRIYDDKKNYYFFVRHRVFFIIPKNAFTSSHDRKAFDDILETYAVFDKYMDKAGRALLLQKNKSFSEPENNAYKKKNGSDTPWEL